MPESDRDWLWELLFMIIMSCTCEGGGLCSAGRSNVGNFYEALVRRSEDGIVAGTPIVVAATFPGCLCLTGLGLLGRQTCGNLRN